MSKEAMTLALEALRSDDWFIHVNAIKALEEALASEQEQLGEPVAYIHRNEYNEYRLEPHDNFDIKSIPFNVDVPLFKAPQPAPQRSEDTTQKKPWVELTDEEIYTESRSHEKWAKDGSEWFSRGSFARAIEAKLKEKNT